MGLFIKDGYDIIGVCWINLRLNTSVVLMLLFSKRYSNTFDKATMPSRFNMFQNYNIEIWCRGIVDDPSGFNICLILIFYIHSHSTQLFAPIWPLRMSKQFCNTFRLGLWRSNTDLKFCNLIEHFTLAVINLPMHVTMVVIHDWRIEGHICALMNCVSLD